MAPSHWQFMADSVPRDVSWMAMEMRRHAGNSLIVTIKTTGTNASTYIQLHRETDWRIANLLVSSNRTEMTKLESWCVPICLVPTCIRNTDIEPSKYAEAKIWRDTFLFISTWCSLLPFPRHCLHFSLEWVITIGRYNAGFFRCRPRNVGRLTLDHADFSRITA